MILSELKSYLCEKKQASLRDLAAKFDTPEDALEGMLEHWERKGVIRRRGDSSCCNGACGHKCSDCPAQCSKIYEWVGEDA